MQDGAKHTMESSKPPSDDPDNLMSRVETGSQGKLPDATTATVNTLEVPALCVDGGALLVTYERYRFRHRRDGYWAWRMKSVVRATPANAARQREPGSDRPT